MLPLNNVNNSDILDNNIKSPSINNFKDNELDDNTNYTIKNINFKKLNCEQNLDKSNSLKNINISVSNLLSKKINSKQVINIRKVVSNNKFKQQNLKSKILQIGRHSSNDSKKSQKISINGCDYNNTNDTLDNNIDLNSNLNFEKYNNYISKKDDYINRAENNSKMYLKNKNSIFNNVNSKLVISSNSSKYLKTDEIINKNIFSKFINSEIKKQDNNKSYNEYFETNNFDNCFDPNNKICSKSSKSKDIYEYNVPKNTSKIINIVNLNSYISKNSNINNKNELSELSDSKYTECSNNVNLLYKNINNSNNKLFSKNNNKINIYCNNLTNNKNIHSNFDVNSTDNSKKTIKIKYKESNLK